MLDGWVISKKLTVNNFEQIEDTSQFNPIPKQPFLNFEKARWGGGDFLAHVRKTAIKADCFTQFT